MLNIDTDLTAVGRWCADAQGHQRRVSRLSGDRDFLDAILIQCIGQFISVNNNTALDSAWSSSSTLQVWAHKPDEARNAMLHAQIADFANRDQFRSVQKLRRTSRIEDGHFACLLGRDGRSEAGIWSILHSTERL